MPGIVVGGISPVFGNKAFNWAAYWATLYQDETILEIQPNGTDGKDATIYNTAPTFNLGASDSIWSGEHNATALIYRALIQFDLSSLPADVVITQCKLNLHVSSDLTNNARIFRIYRLKRAWVEGTGNGSATGDGVTWNTYNGVNNWTAPGAFDPADCEQTPIAIAYTNATPVGVFGTLEFTFNVTSKADLDLGFGWLIKADTELNDAYKFYSSENIVTTKRPGLFIAYVAAEKEGYTFLKNEYGAMIRGYFGSVWYNGVGDYVFYYSDATNVLRATSADGLIWTPDAVNNPVMTPVAGVIEVVQVWKETTWYMLYRSNEWGLGYTAIGLATSPDGITWTKEATNPVIVRGNVGAWDYTSLDPWGVIKIGLTYYLWYNTVNASPRKTGLATSTDLITWTKHASNPIFTNGRFCVTPIKYGSYYYLFVCRTLDDAFAEGATNHLIELYRDTDPQFLSGSREYLGIIQTGGGKGSFSNYYVDTPSIITNNINRDTFPTSDEIWMYYDGNEVNSWWEGLSKGSFEKLVKLQPKAEP